MNKADKDKVIALLEQIQRKACIDPPNSVSSLEIGPMCRQIEKIMRGLEDAAPVCNHEWFQTGAMLANEKRCIKCGEWGKLYTSPQAALKSELSAQAALARLPSEGKPIEALAPTEAALRDVVRQSEDLGLYDADFQIGAQEREAFEAFMLTKYPAHLCHWVGDQYSEMFTRLVFVGWKAGRARSKP